MPNHPLETSSLDENSAQERVTNLQSPEIAKYWLAAIIESAQDAIISKTLEGIITSWNQGAERLFGYTAEEIIGKPITILIPPDRMDEEPGILAKIRSGARVEHYETVRVRKDGSLVDISLTISPIRGADGTIIGASKIARDITERRRAEARAQEALKQAQAARKQAEEASRLKDEFLAVISHELRTPMTAVLGWVRLLRDGRLDDAYINKALETIDRNARSQAQLIEDLLDISRIVSGKMHLEIKTLKPSSVIAAAVDAIRPAAEAKNIRLQLIIDPSAGPVAGDYERLQQVVWNLLSNAVKFTSHGGRVEVRVERVGPNVGIKVSDTGMGIKPEFLPHVFERFSQADSSITRAHGGLGMGLAIVKSIIELHGGTVRAESPGDEQGAAFIVVLPVREAPRQTAHPEIMESEMPSSSSLECPPELAGLRVLVVDDEMDSCEMVGTSFEQCGAKVKIATSAAAALAQMDEWLPDVLIGDISMPEMDGYELIRQIRLREPQSGGEIPAVALTAMVRIEDRMKALTAGYQMHVAKPVELSELRAIVAGLVSVVVMKQS
jgi:PAS domain S-box-containing protein